MEPSMNEYGVVAHPFFGALNSATEEWLMCQLGHEWVVPPSDANDARCPFCEGARIISGYNDLAVTHPDIARLWDARRNFLPHSPLNIGHKDPRKWYWIIPSQGSVGCTVSEIIDLMKQSEK